MYKTKFGNPTDLKQNSDGFVNKKGDEAEVLMAKDDESHAEAVERLSKRGWNVNKSNSILKDDDEIERK